MSERSLHGVNLAGWLTLESWVTPELFAGSGALDEDALISALGRDLYTEVVRKHRASFVTEEDFRLIAARGLNAVRIPVPWYLFGTNGSDLGSCLGCVDEMDCALSWAEEYGIHVIFALAVNLGENLTAQVGGSVDDLGMLRERLVLVASAIARRYSSRTGFFGIALADEVTPQVRRGLTLTDGIPLHMLRNYYREAYEAIREVAGDDVVVIMPDAGIPSGWRRFMAQRHYVNVWLDCHLDRTSAHLDATGPTGVRKLVERGRAHIADARRCGMPVMVGKWSASLPISDAAITPEGRIALERIYTSEQLATYERLSAWFFQTWKTSGLLAGWDARLALATFERAMLA